MITVVVAGTLCAAVIAEVWWWHGGILRVPWPIAGSEGFPLPLVSWASVALYAAWYGWRRRLPPGELLARAIRLGVGVHVMALLASLAWPMAHQTRVELSRWYVHYWHGVWAAALAFGMAGMCRAMAPWLSRRGSDIDTFFLPLMIGYAAFWIHACVLAPLLCLGATVAGVGGFFAAGRDPAKTWLARLGHLARNERWFLAMVFLLALALRLLYSHRILSSPDFLNTGSDGPAYDALAWALVHGVAEPRWGNIPLFAPGYVRFLAVIYWLAGRNYVLVCAAQSVIGALACLLLYDVAKRLFGVVSARIAVVFGAVNFPLIFSAAAIGHQALDLFWTLAVVWCLVRYLEDPARWGRRMIWVGLLLGWAAATRDVNVAFWLFLLGWFVIGVRLTGGWRAVGHAAVISLGCFAVLFPFLAQGSLHGRFAQQWFFYPYSGFDFNHWFNPWRDPHTAWSLAQQQPLEVATRMLQALAGNFTAIFLNQGYGSFDVVFLLRWSTYYYGMWWYAYLLAAAGLALVVWQAVRAPRVRLGWWLLLVLLVSRSLVHLFFEAGYRHRAPLEPYLIMLAAYGLTWVLAPGRGQQVHRRPS